MKHQVLKCPGPPAHTWEREGGRGRPPSTCPDHAPQKGKDENLGKAKARDAKASKNGPRQDADVHTGEPREVPRGNPFIERARNPFIERANAAAKRNTEVVEPPKPRPKPVDNRTEEEKLLEEAEEMEGIIKTANERYMLALKAATDYDDSGDAYEVARNINRLWDKADRAMNNLIMALNRKRFLDGELEKLTAPVV